jgi:hypothetical protein
MRKSTYGHGGAMVVCSTVPNVLGIYTVQAFHHLRANMHHFTHFSE